MLQEFTEVSYYVHLETGEKFNFEEYEALSQAGAGSTIATTPRSASEKYAANGEDGARSRLHSGRTSFSERSECKFFGA